MAIVAYTKQDEYDLVHSNQYCIGWTAVDQTGNSIGKVTDMLINTDTEKVDSVVIDNRARIAAADIALRDGRVVVRGVHDQTAYAKINHLTEAASGAAATTGTYAALEGGDEHRRAGYVSGVTRAAADENEIKVPIVEEQLQIGKRVVEGGGARVRTRVEERPVEESVTLREEQAHVERTPVNRPIEAADAETAFKEGTIEVETYAEVPVVAKEARVVEEVHIGKDVQEREETVRDVVKRTEVDVDELDRNDQRNVRNG